MEYPEYQVHLGYQAVTDGMAVTGRKVTKECQEILDPRELLALLVQKVLKGSKVSPVRRGSLDQVECWLSGTGESVLGKTWMITGITV